MNRILFKELDPNKIQKNTLYKISDSKEISFREKHCETEIFEVVNIKYELDEAQYGIYATEYRSPSVEKKGSKTTDILAGIVDEKEKQIYTLVCDVKRDISAFSDDLLRGDSLITVIKEVRDFIDQINSEMLHKKSFMIYFEADGFKESCETAIITKSFENNKFADAADILEKLLDDNNQDIPCLIRTKMISNLKNYSNEIEKLRKFSQETIIIGGYEYKLLVFILEKDSVSGDYKKDIAIKI